MLNPYTREKIENWIGDFCASDALRPFAGGAREHAAAVLAAFLEAACATRGVEPGEIEEADVKAALLNTVARLNLPPDVKNESPALCGAFLAQLETEGRLGGGRALGAYARALQGAFREAASGKTKPLTRPGSRLKPNDPCPCGSGKKYKKCCLGD